MDVVLEPEVEKAVEAQVESGAFGSVDELLNTAVRQFLSIRKPDVGTWRRASPEALEIMRDFPLNMKWERQHRHEHIGEWVALHKGRLIASGKDLLEVTKSAEAQGIELPFTMHITGEEDMPFWGGWC